MYTEAGCNRDHLHNYNELHFKTKIREYTCDNRYIPCDIISDNVIVFHDQSEPQYNLSSHLSAISTHVRRHHRPRYRTEEDFYKWKQTPNSVELHQSAKTNHGK